MARSKLIEVWRYSDGTATVHLFLTRGGAQPFRSSRGNSWELADDIARQWRREFPACRIERLGPTHPPRQHPRCAECGELVADVATHETWHHQHAS